MPDDIEHSASQYLQSAAEHIDAARAAAERRRDLRKQEAAGSLGKPTRGQRAADVVATVMGSWSFLIAQSLILGAWVVLNIVAWIQHWDPYPFILLNLMLSFQAAYAAPVLLMSANRQAAVDRAQAHNDYLVNQRAEAEVEELANLIHAQLSQGKEILDRLSALGTPSSGT